MPLTKLHVINVCKKDQGCDECRYLEEDHLVVGVHQCLKLSPQRHIVDEEVENHIKNKKHSNRKIIDSPMGDNCKGYPILRHKQVGYDKKTP